MFHFVVIDLNSYFNIMYSCEISLDLHDHIFDSMYLCTQCQWENLLSKSSWIVSWWGMMCHKVFFSEAENSIYKNIERGAENFQTVEIAALN